MRGLRKCIICGKEYKYCSRGCDGEISERWHSLYDNETCRDIFEILSAFQHGHIDANAARKKLNKLGVTNGNNYREEIANQISEIFKQSKPVKFQAKADVEEVVANEEEIVNQD